MIKCCTCHIDKPESDYYFRKSRNKYSTKCNKCTAEYKRKWSGLPPLNTFIEKSSGNADKKYNFEFKNINNRTSSKPKSKKCDYHLCNIVIEQGQFRYDNTGWKYATEYRTYCSKWCREAHEIDLKLGYYKYPQVIHDKDSANNS